MLDGAAHGVHVEGLGRDCVVVQVGAPDGRCPLRRVALAMAEDLVDAVAGYRHQIIKVSVERPIGAAGPNQRICYWLAVPRLGPRYHGKPGEMHPTQRPEREGLIAGQVVSHRGEQGLQ